jgi:hypothetical protein
MDVEHLGLVVDLGMEDGPSLVVGRTLLFVVEDLDRTFDHLGKLLLEHQTS